MENLYSALSKFLHLPAIASAHGAEIDKMILLTHILMFVLFLGWGIFFVYALYRFSKKRHSKADPTGVTSHTSSYLEVVVAVIEAVLLIGFSIPMWSQRVNAFPPQENAVVVRVVAEQFAWNMHYPGADGQFGKADVSLTDTQSNPMGIDRTDPAAKDDLTMIGQLHLPVNKPVIIQLSSKDVIHSFGVPLMRVKQDAIPGMVIPLWFEPTQVGKYEIVCSQLCGLGHYKMKGFITVHSQEDYDAWLAEQAAAQKSSGGGDSFWQ